MAIILNFATHRFYTKLVIKVGYIVNLAAKASRRIITLVLKSSVTWMDWTVDPGGLSLLNS